MYLATEFYWSFKLIFWEYKFVGETQAKRQVNLFSIGSLSALIGRDTSVQSPKDSVISVPTEMHLL